MKNKKNPSKLKFLLSVASTALAFGLPLTPNSAQAFSLVLKSSPSRNPITIADNSRLDLAPSFNTIEIRRVIDGLDIKATLEKSIIRDRFIPDIGTKVNGLFLNLTQLEVTNIGNASIDLGFNIPPNNLFIFFSTQSSFSNPTYASQLLDGSFENGGSRSTVTLKGGAYGNVIKTQTVPRGQSRFNISSDSIEIAQASTNRVSGNLKSLTLPRKGSKLKLPNSACILVLDTPVNGDETQRICESTSVPEPTSVISLLALGAFGGGFLLKRRRKSSSEQ